MKINHLTTNKLKFKIAQNYFAGLLEYELVQHSFDTPEIQSNSCEEIARYSAVFAAKAIDEPCIKMDAGFFIPALGGFPGPFVKYVNEWLSEEKYLALMEGETDRSMYFEDATVVAFPDGSSQSFVKKYTGRIAEPGNYTPSKWPANSLFIPDGYDQPLGSLSDEAQEDYWRDGVLPEVVEYLANRQ
jgi:XTP/dITP diphosphohydrolase